MWPQTEIKYPLNQNSHNANILCTLRWAYSVTSLPNKTNGPRQAQSSQNLRCSLIQAVSQEEPSDRKPDPWPLWMAGHAQLKFVMTECSKTQIRLTGLKWSSGYRSVVFVTAVADMIAWNIYTAGILGAFFLT